MRLVDAAPREGKKLLNGMNQDVDMHEQRKCEHVILPQCQTYQYSVSPGGDRVTVVATIENPYTDKMLAVSLCLSAVGIHTDCRSNQLEEIPAGEQRQISATAIISIGLSSNGSGDSSGCAAVGSGDGASGNFDDLVMGCLVLWASQARLEGGGTGGGDMKEHASLLLSLSISPEERLLAPVPGPHTLKVFPLELAVSATVEICKNANYGFEGASSSQGGGLWGMKGQELVQMLASLFNINASSQARPPGIKALYVPGGDQGGKDGDQVPAARSSAWVALGLCEEGAKHTILRVYAMDELTLGLALQTIQRHLPQFVTMSWRKVPLAQEQRLLHGALEALARELEWGLDTVEALETDFARAGNAKTMQTSIGADWLKLQVETDLAITELCSI